MTTHWLVTESGDRSPHVARIGGAGRLLPKHTLTTAELMSSTRHRTRIDLERLTGIRRATRLGR